MSGVPALILTAGFGTRLRPLTYLRAKGAVPVNGEPLARRVSRWLAAQGAVEQVFNLHCHPASVAAALGDGSELGVRIRYSWEQPILGSAGGPRHALPLLADGGSERFLIVNGDTLTDVDVAGLRHRHAESGALVTMALVSNPAPHKYGGVTLTPDGFVAGFTKPGATLDTYHFVGVQVAEARAFAALPDGVPYESVMKLYPELMRQSPRTIAAFVTEATFRDIGTPADCLDTSLDLARLEGDRLHSPTARIAASAVLERTAVWDDVSVAPGVHLTDCVVGDGAQIAERLSFTRCAIVPAGSRRPDGDERIEHGLLVRPL
jgi:NDP-sugar pyrophosphorylase family protein